MERYQLSYVIRYTRCRRIDFNTNSQIKITNKNRQIKPKNYIFCIAYLMVIFGIIMWSGKQKFNQLHYRVNFNKNILDH